MLIVSADCCCGKRSEEAEKEPERHGVDCSSGLLQGAGKRSAEGAGVLLELVSKGGTLNPPKLVPVRT